MLHIAIVCVSYNSDDAALRFLKSVMQAKTKAYFLLNIQIILVDNTDRQSSLGFFTDAKRVDKDILLVKSENVGYFGGAQSGLAKLDPRLKAMDYVIVSNVDLELDENFFMRLCQTNFADKVGVISPSIISQRSGTDLNPKIVLRPSVLRMRFTEILFSNLISFYFYRFGSRYKKYMRGILKRLWSNRVESLDTRLIYAPHGALIIFSREFFRRGGNLSYPVFLFGEEIFVAETARRLGLDVCYERGLLSYDYGHVSTGKVSASNIRKLHLIALTYLRQKYFTKPDAASKCREDPL